MRCPAFSRRLLPVLLAAVLACPARGADADRLGDLSVEQLLDLKVTSVARREEKLSQSPAAVFVITQEDIRRSGATTIPEMLRLAPGLDVARVDAHAWAIGSRGFNDVFSNKLLVLIDGRSVYTPLFSGVYWDVQDVMLEDLDRIEVIRGPGAALWGANAVNGVINIITKRAAETQGVLMTAGGGTEERAFTSFRFGGMLGTEAHYRVFGKVFGRDDSAILGGTAAHDAWGMAHAGFRVDWTPGAEVFTLQGDLYRGFEDEIERRLRSRSPFAMYDEFATARLAGGNALARWTHDTAGGGQVTVQSYYDRTERVSPNFSEQRDTFDVDVQHRFAWGGRQTIVWGGGYRLGTNRAGNSTDVALHPEARTTHLFNAFAQDQISLVKERLALTLGTKIEHNDFTGFEFQPSARLLWTPTAKQSVWASVSRAVRTPSQAEDDIELRQQPVLPPNALYPTSPAVLTDIRGNRNFNSEELMAYELGYRVEPCARLSLDAALFYNHYRELRTLDLGNPSIDLTNNPARINVVAGNRLDGETYGGEISATWQTADWWKLRADYSLLFAKTHLQEGSADTRSERSAEGSSPRNQASLRSAMDLGRGVELDAALRYVDALPALRVPGYAAFDLRLGWRISDSVEVSVAGRNLFDRRHLEFTPTTIATESTEVERGVFGNITIRF